jgi:nucleotide-binding universal stress UspA family protein
MFKEILIAVDDGETALWAAQTAGQLADATGGRATVIHVVDAAYTFVPSENRFESVLAALRRDGREALRVAMNKLPDSVRGAALLREGHPPDEILAAAESLGADLIVTGSHGRGRIAQFILGSTADALVRRALCPVLIVGHEPRPRRSAGKTRSRQAMLRVN